MRILLALDGSPSSQQARDLVASIPWSHGTSVTLLTAFDIPTAWLPLTGVAGGGWLSGAEDAIRRAADGSLITMAAALDHRGWTVYSRVVQGRAAESILEASEQLPADLIVVGSRGHGAIASMLLGSVSAEVAERARCSVLVARAPRVSRLLVATDGSEYTTIIPAVLGEWASFRGLPSTALSVAPVDSPAFELMVSFYTLGRMSMEQEREELRERYRQHAAAMAENLSAIGIPASAANRSGDAADEVITAAAESEADLVVTGSRRLHGLDRWLLGSVARNVLLHTTASVLIVRQRGAPTAS